MKEAESSKAFTNIMLRATKNIDGFKVRIVKRKEYMDAHTTYSDGFYMEVVSKESASIFSSFSCGNKEIDTHFRNKTTTDSAVCYVYRNIQNHDIVGAASICCSGINMGNASSQPLTPVLLLLLLIVLFSGGKKKANG